MAEKNRKTNLVVRPPVSWRRHFVVGLTVLFLAAAGFYFVSKYIPAGYFADESKNQNGFKAVASIEIRFPGENKKQVDDGVFASPVSLEDMKTQLLKTETLCRGLQIRNEAESPGGCRTIIELTSANSSEADRCVQAAADCYIGNYRTKWINEAKQAHQTALQKSDRAKQSLREAENELLSIDNLMAEEENSLQTRQNASNDRPSPSEADQEPAVQSVENPVWAELKDRVEKLRLQESELLKIKTTLHPDVQSLRGRIADCEEQLAVTPQWVIGVADDPSKWNGEETVPNADAFRPDFAEKMQTLFWCENAVEQAARDYREKIELEKKAWAATCLEPRFTVQVNSAELPGIAAKPRQGWAGTTLFSTMSLALGASFFSKGLATEPVLATIADLEPFLSVPIIGVIPSKISSVDPLRRRRRRIVHRYVTLASAILLIFGGLVVVVGFFLR
jgi:hypothetical protein